MAKILKAIQETRQLAEKKPSPPILPLCSNEAYDTFVSQLKKNAGFAQEALRVFNFTAELYLTMPPPEDTTFEGGFAHLPNLEAHAGATYCNLACLKLFGKLDSVFPENSRQRERLISWLLQRQKVGFNGRSGKDDDSCYTFWVGACLQMLHMDPFIDRDKLLEFITTTWDPMVGGFMRSPDANYVDPLHSFLTVSGLSTLLLGPARTKRSQTDLTATLEDLRLTAGSSKVFTDLLDLIYGVGGDEDKCHEQQSPGTVQGLEFVVPELNIPQSALDRLKEIHRRWRSIEGAGLASWQR
nr:unnamed protein product [Spirometra erinaceieuropaei]